MDTFRLYSSLPQNCPPATRAYINTDALAENYRLLSSVSPSAHSICVVKADAYGHSNEICAPALAVAGCRRFAVSSLAEAVALRTILDCAGYPDTSILILGYTDPVYAPLLRKQRITQCIFSSSYASALNAAADGLIDVHIKLDTGMKRIGFNVGLDDDIYDAADSIISALHPKLNVCGMFTHFSRADEMTAEGDAFTVSQYKRFCAVDSELRRRGVEVPFRHVCNSAGAVRFPQFALDGVRLGILLYGGGDFALCDLPLSPVMRLETVVSHTHRLRKGESVGYGGTFTAERDSLIATLPIGYADGFIRAYKGASVRLYTAKNAYTLPVVGRICMDQCMIDATDTDVSEGDRVVLFGEGRDMLDSLARRAGTIDYECFCLISSRVPRIPVQ